jgi:hypothetical protein
MRYVVACTIASLLGASGALAASNASGAHLTIVFRFDGPYSEQSVREMKGELGTILNGSGIRVDWRNRNQVKPSETFPNLVVVKFRGKCRMDPVPYLFDERGPLGLTYGTGGTVLPFSEIECDKVRESLETVIRSGDAGRSDTLFGRALARVLAHELYHALTGLHAHAQTGVSQQSLSGTQLISGKLRLSPGELERMRAAVAPSPAP